MIATRTTPADQFYLTLPVVLSCIMLLITAVAAYGDTTELLSDVCIDEITAGAAGEYITSYYETPTSAFIDIEPRWWGDMDGFGSDCTANPGFSVTNIPYHDFQYDTFQYVFKNQAEVDQFVKDLPSQGGPPVNIIDTDYIKSNPRAKKFLSGDGEEPRVQEIIITTDRKVDGFFVRDHNGQVITQDVRFDLTFLPPYLASTYEKAKPNVGSFLERSLSFRNEIRYEWKPSRKVMAEMVRNEDGTYSYREPYNQRHNFGAVFLESARTGIDPIVCDSGREIVPPDTIYLKSTIYNDIVVHSPAFGMTIGLAPQGEAVDEDELSGDQTHYPDLDRYQEIGILDIRSLTISLKGGNDIYLYTNEPLPYVCP